MTPLTHWPTDWPTDSPNYKEMLSHLKKIENTKKFQKTLFIDKPEKTNCQMLSPTEIGSDWDHRLHHSPRSMECCAWAKEMIYYMNNTENAKF